MTPIDTAELERLADTKRNRIINRCSADLESIVNGHDPEIHNLNVRVWDRLDRMAVEVEQHLARRKAEAWQPIETAPHETLVVLGWYEGHVWKQEIALASAGTRYPNGYSDRWQHGRASHWRPLPEPPTTPEAEGGCDD